MDEESICFLCDKEVLAQEAVNVTTGLEIIRWSSVERVERIAEELTGISSIYVHTTRRKKIYTRKSSIVSVLESCAVEIFLPLQQKLNLPRTRRNLRNLTRPAPANV